MSVKSMHRNRTGVKCSDRLWRTVRGVHYVQWRSCPTDDEIRRYRSCGVRCRRFGVELFVHQDDQDIARRVDTELRAALATAATE